MKDVELVALIAKGYSSKQIAAELFYSEITIESYRFRLFRKYKCKNAPNLVAHFYETGKLKPSNGYENDREKESSLQAWGY
jgi:DNA-binding NarL/FixJ family response regulator